MAAAGLVRLERRGRFLVVRSGPEEARVPASLAEVLEETPERVVVRTRAGYLIIADVRGVRTMPWYEASYRKEGEA